MRRAPGGGARVRVPRLLTGRGRRGAGDALRANAACSAPRGRRAPAGRARPLTNLQAPARCGRCPTRCLRSCETFRARGDYAFAGNRGKRGFPLGAEGAGVVAALGEGVASLQVRRRARAREAGAGHAPAGRGAESASAAHSLHAVWSDDPQRPPPKRAPQVGQAVACNGAAAFSEYALAKAPMCMPLPGPPAPEAVALVLSAVTACCALEATAGVKAGDVVAVTAAAGGTGHFAVQIAKLAGARVVAITGSPEKVVRLRELGADAVLCHRTEVGPGGRAVWDAGAGI